MRLDKPACPWRPVEVLMGRTAMRRLRHGSVRGKHGAFGRPHGFQPHLVAQHGLVESGICFQVGGANFKPRDGVFHDELLSC